MGAPKVRLRTVEEGANAPEPEIFSVDALMERIRSKDPAISAAAQRLLDAQMERARARRAQRDLARVDTALTREQREQQEREEASAMFRNAVLTKYRPFALKVRTESCPSCTGPSCGIALDCGARFDANAVDHGIDDKPLCKWAGDVGAVRAEAERVENRARRLRVAGIVDREKLRVIPACRKPMDALPVLPERVAATYLRAPRMAAEAVERFLAGGRHLLLWGSPGTWKTWALAVLTAEFDRVVWLNVGDIRPTDDWGAKFEQMMAAQLLVIPDLGTESQQKWSDATKEISRLIAARDDASLPVAIATNLRPFLTDDERNTLARQGKPQPPTLDTYGERVWDRLQRGVVQRVVGPSLRDVLREGEP